MTFAEKHLHGNLEKIPHISFSDFTETKTSMARKKMDFKTYLTDCCPKYGLEIAFISLNYTEVRGA